MYQPYNGTPCTGEPTRRLKHGDSQRTIRGHPHSTWDNAICIECSDITFTPNKSTQLPESDDPIVPHNVSASSTPISIDTSNINKELNTYKDRLALELNNFKKQLETQSSIEVECAKQNLKLEFDDKLRHQTLTQTETINTLRQQTDQLGMQLQQQQCEGAIS